MDVADEGSLQCDRSGGDGVEHSAAATAYGRAVAAALRQRAIPGGAFRVG